MFGTLLTDRLRPPQTPGRHYSGAVFSVAALASFLLFAETVAISAAITGEFGGFERTVVVIAVMIACVGTLVMFLQPWLAKLTPVELRRTHIVGVALVVLALLVGSIRALDSAIRASTVQEKAAAGEALDREQRAVLDRQAEATQELVRLFNRRTEIAVRGGPGLRARLKAVDGLVELQLFELKGLADDQDQLFREQLKLLRDLNALQRRRMRRTSVRSTAAFA